MQILELHAKSASARQISKQLDIPRESVNRALRQCNDDALEEMKDWSVREVPLAMRRSIINLKNMQIQCHLIASQTARDEVKLQAYDQIKYQKEVNDIGKPNYREMGGSMKEPQMPAEVEEQRLLYFGGASKEQMLSEWHKRQSRLRITSQKY